MVKENRIDLLKEFEKQRDNEYIILTTYTFDPVFFDAFLLPKLEKNNQSAEIIVLMDAKQYEQTYPKFTTITGVKYHLLPVYMKEGFFHPKMFIFFSKSENRVTVYLGSANLTLRGFTDNAELISKIEYDLEDKIGRNLIMSLDIIRKLYANGLVADNAFKESVKELTDDQLIKSSSIAEENFMVIHNVDEPILDQLISAIPKEKFDELFVLAPLASCTVLEKILEKIAVGKVIMALQRGNHNVKDIEPFKNVCKQFNVNFELREAVFEDSRKFHSKIIWLKSGKNYLLVGSPNFTDSALTKKAEKGNFEVAVLYKDIDPKPIMSDISFKKISDLKSFLSSAVEHVIETSQFGVIIYSAEFNHLTKKLKVRTEKIEKDVTVCIITEKPDASLKYSINLSRGEFELRVEKGIPKEIIITNGKQSRRRIFYDANYFYKRIPRLAVTLKEIADRIYTDLDLDDETLIMIFSGLARKIENQKSATRAFTLEREERETGKFYEPSSSRIGSLGNLLRSLTKIYEMLKIHEKEERENLYFADEIDGEKIEVRPRFLLIDEEEKKKRLAEKIIFALDKILRLKSSAEANKLEAIVESQATLIHFYLKVLRKIVSDNDLVRDLVDRINENLEEENIKRNQCSRNTRIRLFTYFVCLNYCSGGLNRFDFHRNPFNFIRDLYSYDDLITKETYFEVKRFIKAFTERNYPSLSFSERDFVNYYADVSRGCINPYDAHERILQSCKMLMQEHDPEFFLLLKELLRLWKVWSISDELKNKLQLLVVNDSSEAARIIRTFIED
jgi:HKD family nuclease